MPAVGGAAEASFHPGLKFEFSGMGPFQTVKADQVLVASGEAYVFGADLSIENWVIAEPYPKRNKQPFHDISPN